MTGNERVEIKVKHIDGTMELREATVIIGPNSPGGIIFSQVWDPPINVQNGDTVEFGPVGVVN